MCQKPPPFPAEAGASRERHADKRMSETLAAIIWEQRNDVRLAPGCVLDAPSQRLPQRPLQRRPVEKLQHLGHPLPVPLDHELYRSAP